MLVTEPLPRVRASSGQVNKASFQTDLLSVRSSLLLLPSCRANRKQPCCAATPLPSSSLASRPPLLGPEQSTATSAGSSLLWLIGNAASPPALPHCSCWCSRTFAFPFPGQWGWRHTAEGYLSGFPGCLVSALQLKTFLRDGISVCEGSMLVQPGGAGHISWVTASPWRTLTLLCGHKSYSIMNKLFLGGMQSSSMVPGVMSRA